MRPVARAIPFQVDPGIAVSAGGHALLLALLIWGGFMAPRPMIEMGGGPVITVRVERTSAPAPDVNMDSETYPVQPIEPTISDPTPTTTDEDAPPVKPTTTALPGPGPLDLPPDKPVTQPPEPVVAKPVPTIDDQPVGRPDKPAPVSGEPAISEPVTRLGQGRGPTEVELVGLKLAISDCWNLGTASTEAMRTTITVLVEMRPDGTASAVTLLSSDGPSERATDVAFKAAQSAIYRCAAKNRKPLAPERYEDWRQIEMTFDPSKMR